MNKRYIPGRTCIGCMKKFNQDELLRIVKTKDGNVVCDTDKKVFGRGAYLCKNKKCITAAQKKSKLSRALRCEVKAQIYENLLNLFGDENG